MKTAQLVLTNFANHFVDLVFQVHYLTAGPSEEVEHNFDQLLLETNIRKEKK